ncbi:DUF1611 domain-containing protein [Ruegeria sp. A3M17]|uniref:DUF1611 domain-containing protein n=1 Tax=Ruegeria sp. A3M17 TaxID=2267229 RepID=UPI001F35A73D|nr:DUF1611 domain-containing protein [Ruegeria sp. A3M17]
MLQHAPKRERRCDFPNMAMPDPCDEITLIEAFADTEVIGMTINHEGMNETEITKAITGYNCKLYLPITDALNRPSSNLVNMVLSAFPRLQPIPVATRK